MRPVVATIAIVSVCVTGGVLWLCRGHYFTTGSNDSRPAREIAVPAPSKDPPLPDPKHGGQDENKLSDRDDPARIRMAIEAGNVPIEFWGRVVDQDGVPLSEVRIAYMYSVYHGNDQGVAWIEHEGRKGETVSNGDGSFAIKDLTGHDLTIESVRKTDYVYRQRSSLTYDFGGNMREGRFKPQRDKPVRIVMIYKGAMDSLIHMRGSVDVSGDGTAEHWNLWSGEADPSGELLITYKAELAVPANPAQLFNWSANLGIVGGGIIESSWDEDFRRAPETGYSATVAYLRVVQKQSIPHRSFYLHTADGKYGRLEVELSPSHDGRTARCFITSDMNPQAGSRVVEPTDEE
jgi:hypothetical protein